MCTKSVNVIKYTLFFIFIRLQQTNNHFITLFLVCSLQNPMYNNVPRLLKLKTLNYDVPRLIELKTTLLRCSSLARVKKVLLFGSDFYLCILLPRCNMLSMILGFKSHFAYKLTNTCISWLQSLHWSIMKLFTYTHQKVPRLPKKQWQTSSLCHISLWLNWPHWQLLTWHCNETKNKRN